MYPYLFCLSVVILSQVLECFEETFFWDVSDDCSNGRNISMYLTTGMGGSDAFVFLIAKPEQVNCTLNFLVSKGNHILLVVEFLDWMLGTSLCGNVLNKVNVMVRPTERINICAEDAADNIQSSIYRSFGEEIVSVSVVALQDMDCIKIIATSVRGTQVSSLNKLFSTQYRKIKEGAQIITTTFLDSSGKECYDYEIKCPYGNQVYCMTKELECDGNLNCGIRDEFDEDKGQCEKYLTVTPAMVIVGAGIAFISFTLLVALLKNLLPSRKGTFIFKEDETLSEKDRATSQQHFQVKLKVLYGPNEMRNVEMISLEEDYRPIYRQGILIRKLRHLSRKD